METLEEPDINLKGRTKDDLLDENENKFIKKFIGQLAWAANITHPDIAYETCEASMAWVVKSGQFLMYLK